MHQKRHSPGKPAERGARRCRRQRKVSGVRTAGAVRPANSPASLEQQQRNGHAVFTLAFCAGGPGSLYAPGSLPLKPTRLLPADASVKKVSASSKAASKKSASKDVRNAKRNVKKTSAQKQKTQRKNGKKQSRVTRESVDSRDVWLRRAQESEIMTGKASWYGRDFHGGPTASGLNYDMYTFTAAHRTLPMGTVVRVTDQENGKSVMVCVTDRGPFVRGRIIDLSYAAAQQIDIGNKGVGRVALEVVSDESGTPLSPDEAYYVRYKAAMAMRPWAPTAPLPMLPPCTKPCARSTQKPWWCWATRPNADKTPGGLPTGPGKDAGPPFTGGLSPAYTCAYGQTVAFFALLPACGRFCGRARCCGPDRCGPAPACRARAKPALRPGLCRPKRARPKNLTRARRPRPVTRLPTARLRACTPGPWPLARRIPAATPGKRACPPKICSSGP